ncbi:MAG: hypothetical protein ACFFCP_15345, partial [Promethearchaeota archaeon]
MEYRIAGEDDIDEIISLWDESRIYHEKLDSRFSMVDDAPSRVRDYCHEQMGSENAVYFLAVHGEDTIGYICAQLQKTPPVFKHSHIGFIDGLFV